MKIKLDPNDPASVIASVREFLTETQSVYQGMIDQVPETFRKQITSLKDKVDVALSSLASKPTDQVPAALDAASTLRSLTYMVDRMQEMISGTMEALNAMAADFTPKVNTLTALQGRIEKKELIEATEVEKQLAKAREDAAKTEREHQVLLNSRRTLLAKADVPLPVEDAVLDGDDKAFEATKTRVMDRTKKLREMGQLQVLNSEDLVGLIYGPDTQFNCVIKAIETATKGTVADPLLGGKTPENKPKRLCIA